MRYLSLFSGIEAASVDGDPMFTLTKGDKHAVAVAGFSAGQSKETGSIAYQEEMSPTLRAGASGTNQTPTIHSGMMVRRLTPIEAERLQGFEDNYTRIPWQKKPVEKCPDGQRYKCLGNSMAVPVMKYIGERIQKIGVQQ